MGVENGSQRSDFENKVELKAIRKIKAQKRRKHSFWESISVFGLVGWSVVIPTLLGVALGIWIDKKYPGRQSWTLTFLIVGMALGCLNAWYWVDKENKQMEKDLEDDG